jgi:hypothetical protein
MLQSIQNETHTTALQRALIVGHWLRNSQDDISSQETEEIANAVLNGAFTLLAVNNDGRLQPLVPPDIPGSSLTHAAQQHIREEWRRLSAGERANQNAERRAFLSQMRTKYAHTPRS